MSLENPIKIEPKHIYEYNTNIVNNNKIDYVKLTEYEVSMPETDVINESFVCRERKPSSGGWTYSTTLDLNYYNLFDNEKNRYFPVLSMYRNWSSISVNMLRSHYVYYKIPFVANSTGNVIAFNFQRNVSYRDYDGDEESKIDLEKSGYTFLPKDGSVYCGGTKYSDYRGDRREYVYFNTFASEEAFENKYIHKESWGRDFLKSISNYHIFIAGLAFQNGKGTLMLIVDEFDYFRASGGAQLVKNILLNFTISLSMDVYKSEQKTLTFALDNGVLKNVDDITNWNYRNKKGYTLPDNPFLTNLTVRTDLNNRKVSEVIAENILTKFKNGKQTATMTVNCKDYYDILGNKVIGEGMDRKTLKAGDIVIPYIKPDVPLAREKDGTPKKFCITSAEFEYSGRPLMNLIMEEVIE